MKVTLVSYSKPVLEGLDTPTDLVAFCARVSNPSNQINSETAEKLIKYLIKHQHWSPLEMATMCLEIETTRDIARQILRHRSFSFQELQFTGGRRYIVRASNSATRGIAAPDSIWLDEAREYHDPDVWSSLRFTQMASPNPQAFLLSNAGDQHSVVLNSTRERALASILTDDLSLGWWEWSSPPEIKFDDSAQFWQGIAQANPSLGYTIHPDNIRAVLNDPEDIVRTEVCCLWVSTINPVIHPSQWAACAVEGLRLDPSADTWLAVDLSPDRRQAALVASQRIDRDRFQVQLLQTWTNPGYLSDKLIANDIGDWYRKLRSHQPKDGSYLRPRIHQ